MSSKICPDCKVKVRWKGKTCGKNPIVECMTCGYREHTRQNKPMEKKIGKGWFYYGRKSGFGLGFEITKWGWNVDFIFWYIGQEF